MKQIGPGAVVMLLPTPNTAHDRHAGEIHVVGKPIHDGWRMDPPVLVGGLNLMWTRRFLRLLDDPGDDAEDESLSWLASPVELAQGTL